MVTKAVVIVHTEQMAMVVMVVVVLVVWSTLNYAELKRLSLF